MVMAIAIAIAAMMPRRRHDSKETMATQQKRLSGSSDYVAGTAMVRRGQ